MPVLQRLTLAAITFIMVTPWYGCDPGVMTIYSAKPGAGSDPTTSPGQPGDPEIDPMGASPGDIDPVTHGEPEPPSVQPLPPERQPPEVTTEPEPDPTPEGIPPDEDPYAVEGCDFNYPVSATDMAGGQRENGSLSAQPSAQPSQRIAYLEPLPDYLWRMSIGSRGGIQYGPDALTMPGYQDELPLFERAGPWTEPRRCYELPTGARLLTQEEAYDLYVRIVRETLWFEIDQSPGVRTTVGIRGAYPGTFDWHGDAANRFNDTIILLWRDTDGRPHVREFPVNTGTGAYNFGYHSSSSLLPNRHYPYENGWHRSYNALRMGLSSYAVRDDANKNGHWDADRNGWMSGGDDDHDRMGSGHNIHMGSVEGDLKDVPVNRWSAGCQVIPGSDNWTEFIGHAWTNLGDQVDYYLVDARDVSSTIWTACDVRDGSHECPHQILEIPYEHDDDTTNSHQNFFETYNCSDANEGGNERVYVLNIRETGTLSVSLTVENEEAVDPDVHLLWGDDANACLARGHRTLERRVSPGRYIIVVDTWVNDDGNAMAGAYTLRVDLN